MRGSGGTGLRGATLLTAAGVKASGGGPVMDFGEPSLAGGLITSIAA